MVLTTHPLLALRSRMGQSYTSRPLVACYRVNFTFYLLKYHNRVVWIKHCCCICWGEAWVLFDRCHIWQCYMLHQASFAVAMTVFYRYDIG
jgi:hypothetical protein